MKLYITLLILCLCTLQALSIDASPITPTELKSSVTELGLTFPVKSSPIKSYIDSHGITTIPFTSGYSTGAEIGRHVIIANQASIGALASCNMFIGADSASTNQIYQLNIYCMGRLYFGDSWRGGLFAELGAGPECSAAKFTTAPFVFQVNIGARVGAGYNYKFTDDVTVGASVLAAPSLSASSIVDGMKVAISMLW